MKTGRTLQEIAAELERQVAIRKDYIAPQGKIQALVDGGAITLDGFNGAPMAVDPWAHQNLADHLGIPRKYYDRMLAEQPALLAENLNGWLHADPKTSRMVRTLDGRARAVLSPKFRPLDNYDLAQAVLPTLLKHDVQIVSCELTETRMYIKGILPTLSDTLPEGLTWGQGHGMVGANAKDGRLVAAIVISNSEVGAGTLRVEPSVFTTWCTNLAIMMQAAMKKYHVGRAWEGDANLEVFRDETRAADDRAFFMKVTDVTMAAFSEDTFKAAVAQIREAAGVPILSGDLPKVVEVATKRLALPDRLQSGILTSLARGGEFTKWGLSSALTFVAGQADTYELATTLERAGGEVLTLTGNDWKAISEAEGATKVQVLRD